jgi:hypothetical protein
MCFRDVLDALQADGVRANAVQIRWAISSGRVSRPPLDGSLRFDFGAEHLAALRKYFKSRRSCRRSRVSMA